MTPPTPRRTQAQRRDATIARLLDATVSSLDERGYGASSTTAICAEAGVSQGALFRHFPTRQALLVAAADHVAELSVRAFRERVGDDVTSIEGVVATLSQLRTVVLSPTHQTWRELLVAARSDAELRTALRPARLGFQERMLDVATDLWGGLLPPDDLPAVLSIVVNMLDGLAFSALDTAPDAQPGRTVERALVLLAEMIVARYPQENR